MGSMGSIVSFVCPKASVSRAIATLDNARNKFSHMSFACGEYIRGFRKSHAKKIDPDSRLKLKKH